MTFLSDLHDLSNNVEESNDNQEISADDVREAQNEIIVPTVDIQNITIEKEDIDEEYEVLCMEAARYSVVRKQSMAKDEEDDTLPDKDAAKGFYAKYEPKEVLGRGISSVVRRCIDKESGKEYAAKIIDIGGSETTDPQQMLESTRQEINILRQVMGHPYIIELQDVFESDAFIFLVFELCRHGELFDYLTSVVTLSEKKTRFIMRQIFEGVDYIHSRNIVHRDLKPENILLDDSLNVKITDFGFARHLADGSKLYDLCGTPGYLAPETLKCNMFDDAPGYSKEVDIWACGVIMFTLLVGCPPFWHRKQMIMLRNIMEGKYSFMSPEWSDISGECEEMYESMRLSLENIPEDPKDLIRRCLVVDPDKRINVRECLRHPFFNTVNKIKDVTSSNSETSDNATTTSSETEQTSINLINDTESIKKQEPKKQVNIVISYIEQNDEQGIGQLDIKFIYKARISRVNKTINPVECNNRICRFKSMSINMFRSLSFRVLNRDVNNNQQDTQRLISHSHHSHHRKCQCSCVPRLFFNCCFLLRRQSQFNPRKKFQFAILCVRAMIRIQRLRFTPEPLDFEEAMRDPYRVKVLRKVIDACAFRVYGHWVKKGEGQNRAALFENQAKTELVNMYIRGLNH
ncbi:CLUMA_CG008434, isoform A [Clunio marinus]|uniref:phosphorylase kinase n=1 Tax=Clunio marinus TaxID=568069 RepID=A0A1J1I3Q9_9DIPT|nr:CLUMA_CG008434, isoform A [Clunio marinus]